MRDVYIQQRGENIYIYKILIQINKIKIHKRDYTKN